jgi:hypothetical protein
MCALEKESPTSPLQLVSRRHQVRLATSFDISTFLWCLIVHFIKNKYYYIFLNYNKIYNNFYLLK